MAVMYRRVILSLLPRSPALTRSPEPTCTPPLRARTALRAAVQVSCRALGSTRVVLCEEKNRTSSPPPVKVNNDEGRSEEPNSRRPETTEPTEPEQTTGKSSKKALLELLGAMKVEVTTKRRTRPSNQPLSEGKPPPEPEPKPEPTEEKSTTSKAPPLSESLSEELVAAVTAAASTLPNSSRVKSELLQQLHKHEKTPPLHKRGESPNIQKIIADMAVGKKPSGKRNANMTDQFQHDDDDQGDPIIHLSRENDRRRRARVYFAPRLNIFPIGQEQETEMEPAAGPSLWDADLASELVNVLNTQPRNGFEEMIQWTREGKMWQYPIDNEAGMDEEASVPFHEHVFLEHHLVDGFPQQGPVRHFMELVVTGLSKNHQLTVQQKLEHIAWFREYFQQKQDILKEAEAY